MAPNRMPDFQLFEPLSASEVAIRDRLVAVGAAQDSVLALRADPASPEIRARFLRWFLLEATAAAPGITRVELSGATVKGTLDLVATRLMVIPRFVDCHFPDPVLLNDSTVLGVEFLSCHIAEIGADRLTATGSFVIRGALPSDAWLAHLPPPVVSKQISLCGAKIRGNLDLRRCDFHGPAAGALKLPLVADGLTVEGNVLFSEGFQAQGELRLNGSKISRNLDCSGATLCNPEGYTLSAAGAKVGGTLYLCQTPPWSQSHKSAFTSRGILRLEGIEVDGDLDCSGGVFTAPAVLGRHMVSGASADDPTIAILASGLNVHADIHFSDGFHALGAVKLIGGRVGGDVYCAGGFFDRAGADALYADGVTVLGTTFLNEGAKTNGRLRFVQASLNQGFYADGAIFEVPASSGSPTGDQDGICGIYAPTAEVRGTFLWQGVKKEQTAPRGSPVVPLSLDLSGSKAETVADDEASWALLNHFNVTGCEYASITDFSAAVDWRLTQLDRQYAKLNPSDVAALTGVGARLRREGRSFGVGCKALWRAVRRAVPGLRPKAQGTDDDFAEAMRGFAPQPYLQLAKIARANGFEAAAMDILVRLERNKTRYSDFGVRRQLWRWTLDLGLRYGFSPFRPVWILLFWAFVSAGVFEIAYDKYIIVPATANQAPSGKPQEAANPRIAFNALVYAVDTLVPLVDLNQKRNWVVGSPGPQAPPAPQLAKHGWLQATWRAIHLWPHGLAANLLIVNTFLGWLLTSLFAAGVTGLLRSGKEAG